MFYCRINRNLLQILEGSLALSVKTSYRIDLIPPQFDSPWIFLCEAVDIHNTTANRKLSRHFHLTYTLISQIHQFIFQLIHVYRTVIFIMNQLAFYFFQRFQEIHASVNACDNCKFLFLQQCPDYFHSLSDQQISMNICLKE